jgi:hypothetical protein
MITRMAMEVKNEARKSSAGDSFATSTEGLAEHEVRGERKDSERGGSFPLKENDGAGACS